MIIPPPRQELGKGSRRASSVLKGLEPPPRRIQQHPAMRIGGQPPNDTFTKGDMQLVLRMREESQDPLIFSYHFA